MAETREQGLEKGSERPNETSPPPTAQDTSGKITGENGNTKVPPSKDDSAQKHLPPLEVEGEGAKKAQNAPDKPNADKHLPPLEIDGAEAKKAQNAPNNPNASPPARPEASAATNSPEPRGAAAAQDAPPPRGAVANQDAPPPSRSAPPPDAPQQQAPSQNKSK